MRGPKRSSEGERERDLARRGRSFISRDKEKETTRPAWTINSLPDTHACPDAHTHTAQHSIIQTLKNIHGEKKNWSFSQSYTKSQKLKELICLLCGTKSLGTAERVYKPIILQQMKRGKYCMLNGNKVKNKWEYCEREMIYRFNDSAHYLF